MTSARKWIGGCKRTHGCPLHHDHDGDCTVGEVSETEYEMEAIISQRCRRGRLEYLVRWVGWPEEDATWEPASAFRTTCRATLDDWLSIQRSDALEAAKPYTPTPCPPKRSRKRGRPAGEEARAASACAQGRGAWLAAGTASPPEDGAPGWSIGPLRETESRSWCAPDTELTTCAASDYTEQPRSGFDKQACEGARRKGAQQKVQHGRASETAAVVADEYDTPPLGPLAPLGDGDEGGASDVVHLPPAPAPEPAPAPALLPMLSHEPDPVASPPKLARLLQERAKPAEPPPTSRNGLTLVAPHPATASLAATAAANRPMPPSILRSAGLAVERSKAKPQRLLSAGLMGVGIKPGRRVRWAVNLVTGPGA